jgi:hypothetical protein
MKEVEFTKEQVIGCARKVYNENVADFEIRKDFMKPQWCPF